MPCSQGAKRAALPVSNFDRIGDPILALLKPRVENLKICSEHLGERIAVGENFTLQSNVTISNVFYVRFSRAHFSFLDPGCEVGADVDELLACLALIVNPRVGVERSRWVL